MGKYKISDLERLSGVKSHTIRVWEKRYDVLTPLRTDTNIRFYDDAQLRKLLNIVSLINSGSKISKISKLSDGAINDQINALLNVGSLEVREELIINQLISSGLSYDEFAFEKSFSRSILSFGLIKTYQRVIYPMLVKIGFLWTMAELTISQEHFVTSLLKQKILSAIDSVNVKINTNFTWILYLPEGEMHDIGLLIASYSLKMKGINVVYLGKDVKSSNLLNVIKTVNPTHILTFVVRNNLQNLVNSYLKMINDESDSLKTFTCCGSFYNDKLNLNNNQKIITSFEDFLTELDKMSVNS